MLTAPKYKRIELLLKKKNIKDSFESITKLTFENSAFIITGNSIMIIKEKEELTDKITVGEVFSVDTIKSYKLTS